MGSSEKPKKVSEAEMEKYKVYSPLEIAGILRRFQSGRSPVRMTFSGERGEQQTSETIMTYILEVNVEDRQFIVDSPVPELVPMAIKSEPVNFEGARSTIWWQTAVRDG